MRVPSLLLLAALAMAGAGLSGCLEAPSFLTASDAEATAMDNRDLAHAAALAWSPDAQLVGVLSFESTNGSEFDLPADPAVGNGRALAWWYSYEGANATRAFRVTADGQVTVENETVLPESYDLETPPLEGWAVDSDAALAAAAANETFAAVLQGESASLVEALAATEGQSNWYLAAFGDAGFVLAVVDGRTGDLISVDEMGFDFAFHMPAMPDMPAWTMPGPAVLIEDEGTLSGGAKKEYPFTLDAAATAHLMVAADRELPTDGLRWAVLDAEGEVVEAGDAERWTSGDDDEGMEAEFGLDAGKYTLVLQHKPGTLVPGPVGGVEYELHFMATPGFAMHGMPEWDDAR